MTNNLIVKSNQVVEAGYELTTNEQRLILLGISKIPKEQDINPYFGYEITAQEFATAYNIHPKTAYRELRKPQINYMNARLSLEMNSKR